MIILNHTPLMNAEESARHYARAASEGMAHSAMMCGEEIPMADSFNEDWAFPSVTWSLGGKETYLFNGKRAVNVHPVGVMTIAAGERYAYRASNEAPFRSNMVSFPRWMVKEAGECEIAEAKSNGTIATSLRRPSQETFSLMSEIAARCVAGEDDTDWFVERVSLLYHRLLNEQSGADGDKIGAAKTSTREELARRVSRSVQFILENYADTTLTITDIAGAACLSRFHFIRIFKEGMGATPMQYLSDVRMSAARRLLEHCEISVAEIASSVGYEDRPAFVRAFRRRYGAPPSAFRS